MAVNHHFTWELKWFYYAFKSKFVECLQTTTERSNWNYYDLQMTQMLVIAHYIDGLLCRVSTDHGHQGLRCDLIFLPNRSLVGNLYTKMHSNAHRLWQIAVVGSRGDLRIKRRFKTKTYWIAGRRRSPGVWSAVTCGHREPNRGLIGLIADWSAVTCGHRWLNRG